MRRTQRAGRRLGEEDGSPARLAKLESLFAAGHFTEAMGLGESMLGQPGSATLLGRVRLQLAMTYLQLGRTDLAGPLLAEARPIFEAVNDAEMIVGCMAAAANVACLEQRPDAIRVAMTALAACRSLKEPAPDLELQILSSLAGSQLVAGRRREAIGTFEEAIARADPVVDMRRLGKLLGNAGIAYREMGQLDKAMAYSKRAVALFETLQDLASLAREENNLGYYLFGRGELGAARIHLERSLQLFEHANVRRGETFALLSLCELCLVEGDLEKAMQHAEAALEVGESLHETWSVADARMWKGRVAARLGDDAAVDAEVQRALAVLESSGMAHRLVECHALYAAILELRGDLPRAYGHLKAAVHIAGRSDNGPMIGG